MIGALYIRVSTTEQLEFSPEAQKRAILNYAQKNNIKIPNEYIFCDNGVSGKNAKKRPMFMKMINMAKNKPRPFDVILVHKYDRFARNREDSVVYKSMLKRECGIKVISITEHIEDDKFSIIFESMLEAMAEYYSINLAEEVKKGMTEKALKGEYQTCPPFGYEKKENKPLLVKENEAFFVKYIYNEYLKGRSVLSIAKKINEFGIKTHKGNKFDSRIVKYILQNPVYIGFARWTPSGKRENKANSKDTIIKKSNHQSIIDEKTFYKVQEIFLKKKRLKLPSKKNCKHWLSGVFVCENCGSVMVKSGKKYFQCGFYTKGKCSVSHALPIKEVEKIVINELNNLFKKYNLKPEIKLISNQKSDIAFQKSKLQKLISLEEKKIERARNAFLNGIETIDEYKIIKSEIEKQIDLLNSQLKQYKDSVVSVNILDIENFLFGNYSIEIKNNFIKSIIKKIEYKKNTNKLKFYFRAQ